MSDYNPAPKAGYTKTGKSLKAVRRYYALMNQQKQKSPDEDKLSKRIAAELKTQQDANEKRSRREIGQPLLLTDQSTERSDLPAGVMVSPKDTGPVFIAPTAPSQPPQQQQQQFTDGYKTIDQSGKSVKSYKSIRNPHILPDILTNNSCCTSCIYFTMGLIIGVAIGVLCYMFLPRLIADKTPVNKTVVTKPPTKQ